MKKLNGKQFMCVRVAIILLIAYAIAVIEGVWAAYGISWRTFPAFALVVALFTGLFIYAFRDKTEPQEGDESEEEASSVKPDDLEAGK